MQRSFHLIRKENKLSFASSSISYGGFSLCIQWIFIFKQTILISFLFLYQTKHSSLPISFQLLYFYVFIFIFLQVCLFMSFRRFLSYSNSSSISYIYFCQIFQMFYYIFGCAKVTCNKKRMSPCIHNLYCMWLLTYFFILCSTLCMTIMCRIRWQQGWNMEYGIYIYLKHHSHLLRYIYLFILSFLFCDMCCLYIFFCETVSWWENVWALFKSHAVRSGNGNKKLYHEKHRWI